MSAVNHSLPIGEVVGGNYEILGIVGAGGMGIVYRSRDLKLTRIVALKFLPPEMDSDEREREYFLLEARTASSLDHPNIGVIHGIEETSDGRAFIVMAFYDGQTLAQRLARGPLPVKEAVDIACQIACGLQEAHSRKIVHRDIKPSNIMITPSGTVKIVDFGLARVITGESASVTGITGTVKYMSPEQAMGRRVDQRTDIWSLGVVLSEMLLGGNPFERPTVSAILMALLHEAPQPMPDTVPLDLQRIVYRALSKTPESRYQTSGEMLADLEAFQATLVSAPPTPPHESSKGKNITRSSELRKYVEKASTSAWNITPPRKRSPWLPWVLAGSGVAVAAGVFFSPALRERLHPGSGEKHVAILPFQTAGSNPADTELVEGLVDSIAGKLSNLDVDNKALWIIPTSEVRRLKVADPAAALKDFGANYVVNGSVLRNGKSVDLNLNLIDTRNLRLIGSANVEDQAGDLATLQDQAVTRLAKLMNLSVASGTMKNAAGTAAPVAYEDYLTALGYMQRYDKPGNLDLAVNTLRNAVETDPNFALGRAELGEAFRFKYIVDQNPRWLDEAEANARKAIELDSQLPASYITLGWVHDQTGKHDLALQEFQQALRLDPLNGLAMAGLARSYRRSGRIADAEATYQRAIALRSNDWDAYNNYAQFLNVQGRSTEAITQFKKALQLTPDNAQVLANLGASYIDTGDPKLLATAEQSLQRSIAIAPTYEAYANLGMLYLKESRFQESAAVSEKALQLNDKNYDVWTNLLACYKWLNLPDKQAEVSRRLTTLLEETVRLNPNDGYAHITLAELYAAAHQRDKSLSHLQTALALSPNDPDILENSADTYALLGDRPQAVAYLNRAIKSGVKEDQLRIDPYIQEVLHDPGVHLVAKR